MPGLHGSKDDTTSITMVSDEQIKGNESNHKTGPGDNDGFESSLESMPKGYYLSPFFIGTFFATGLGYWAGNSGFAYPAPILSIINADLGPDPNVTWVVMVHPVGLSVGMTIVGRLGDIFGRCWFFISGAFLAMMGTLVMALSVNINMMICGAMIKALAASTQLSCFYALAELLPSKFRYLLIGVLNIFQIPGSVMAPAVANSLILRSGSWRSVFYLLTAINATSLICYVFFYHPPNFHQKHGMRERRIEYIKNFDYVGTLLYATGLVFFLLGLSWGGSKYPWKSAQVISFIVLGQISLISFVLWECLVPLKEPLIPMELFKNRHWVVATCLTGIGAGVFYAGGIIWPTLVANFYARGNVMKGAYLSCLSGAGIVGGGCIGGFLAKPLGYQKIQATVAMTAGGALLAAVSTATPENEARTCAIFFFAGLMIGYNNDISLGNTILTIKDQRQIGAAGGAAATGRTAIAAICQSVYSVVLSNKRAKNIPVYVIPAATQAGLPQSSVKALLQALSVGTPKAFAAVPGLTPTIQQAGFEQTRWG